MNARIPNLTLKDRLRPIIEEEVKKEYSARYTRHQADIQDNIARQVTAMVLYTLDRSFGWKKKRLHKFMDELSATLEDMNGIGFAGGFSAGDLIRSVEEDYGIDLKSEIKTEIDNRNI